MTLDPGKGLSASTLTTADGRTLRYVHAGEGGPVVVFEAGLSACASEWVAVQRLVAAATRTVSYDRAGHAGSTTDTQARSLTRICEDLHALIEHVSPDEPVVLVAHSWGGPMVRCYADQHPDRVAGVVMVDTTTIAVMPEKTAKMMPTMMSVSVALHSVGLAKPILGRALFKKAGPELSAEDRGVIGRDMTSKQSAKTAVAEAKAVPTSLALMARRRTGHQRAGRRDGARGEAPDGLHRERSGGDGPSPPGRMSRDPRHRPLHPPGQATRDRAGNPRRRAEGASGLMAVPAVSMPCPFRQR